MAIGSAPPEPEYEDPGKDDWTGTKPDEAGMRLVEVLVVVVVTVATTVVTVTVAVLVDVAV